VLEPAAVGIAYSSWVAARWEIRRGVQGLEQQLSDHFADAARQTRVNLRLTAALFVALVAGLSGLAVGLLVID
jgi:hypothetical protein